LKKGTSDFTKAISWTLLDRFSVIFMQFGGMIVLARLLLPEDFALLGIALFFIGISQILIDSGMGGSLLQKKNVTDLDYSTLFVYNMAVAIVMYLLIVLSAPFIEDFYSMPDLSSILSIIGISLIISAAGKIQNILLYKSLSFKTISKISIFASFLGLVVAIIIASLGYGVWALVYQNILYASTVLVLQFINNGYLPKIAFSKSSFKEQWAFGGSLLYSKIINSIYLNVFQLIFPKIASLNFAGLYTQANRLQQIPASVVNSVMQGAAFPVMSKIKKQQELVLASRRLSRKVYLVSFSVYAFIAIFSKEIIEVVLGTRWIAAANILSILSMIGIGTVISYVHRNIYKSAGLTRTILYNELWQTGIGVFFLVCTFTMGHYAILWGMVSALFISNVLLIRRITEEMEIASSVLYRDIVLMSIPVVGSTLLALLLKSFLSELSAIGILLLALPIFILLVLVLGLAAKNKEVIYLYNILKRKIK